MLGIKMTGDTNVPAGNVSFRAKIGRKHRRSGFDLMYPPELEIIARYAGEGRVAHKGFKDARCDSPWCILFWLLSCIMALMLF